MRWIFNGAMIWHAILGYCIISTLFSIQDIARHEGPGYITYEEPERIIKVTETQYKREEYTHSGTALAFLLFLWITTARELHKKEQERTPTDQ